MSDITVRHAEVKQAAGGLGSPFPPFMAQDGCTHGGLIELAYEGSWDELGYAGPDDPSFPALPSELMIAVLEAAIKHVDSPESRAEVRQSIEDQVAVRDTVGFGAERNDEVALLEALLNGQVPDNPFADSDDDDDWPF
jgi:hypothetical protein